MKPTNTVTFNYDLVFRNSRKKAFAYLRQIERRKEFMLIADSTVISRKASGSNLKGTRFKEITHFLGFNMDLEYEIADFRDGELIATKCTDGPFFPYMEIRLSGDEDERCEAHVTVSLHTDALKLMPDFLLKPSIEAIIKRILKKLTARIEAKE